jgi:predicted XRE-type DNA-binding protein
MAHFNAMPVVVRGRQYPSQKDAAAALGITQSALSHMLAKRGNLAMAGLGPTGAPGNQNNARPFKIGPLTFASRVEAARALGVSRSQITKWISPKASAVQREMLLAAVMRASDAALSERR